MPSTLHGTGVSAGLVIGNALWLDNRRCVVPRIKINADQVDAELERLDAACELSKQQLTALQLSVKESLGDDHASIFTGHQHILDDPELRKRIASCIKEELCGVEQACEDVLAEFCAEMAQIDDEYLRERLVDIRDVGERILCNLLGIDPIQTPEHSGEPRIVVADDIPPSVAARLNPARVAAFITASGSRTSHTAILARALNIPAVVAVREPLSVIRNGTCLALDGASGVIHVGPTQEIISVFKRRNLRQRAWMSQILSESNQPIETLDGYQVRLVANVELPVEAMNVRQRYNVGIGLFRTEFMFINGASLLDEERQFIDYRDTAQAVYPLSVIFRTLDIGGDKFLSELNMPHELNPFMGMRAIRFSLSRVDIFKVQLRAILRASAFGKVRIMFPMISTLDELQQALTVLDEVKNDLRANKVPFNEDLDVGCMIEVPAAALLAERLIQHVDFFSLGTNDLVQYSLAADRSNPDIAYLYQPIHPSVIRMMKHVADVCYANGKWVGICGEMAAEPLYAPLILGMGIHELSMSPVSLAPIRKLVRNIRMFEAEALVAKALQCGSAGEVQKLCRDFLKKSCPELLFEDNPDNDSSASSANAANGNSASATPQQ
ncbi:MAG: phosphoenolpyruvate--protein phosphotransferase [Lentisphaeria bacterium]|jgi:phosphotransferase system enzyme I (PtsI)